MRRRKKHCGESKETFLLEALLESQAKMEKQLKRMEKEIHKMPTKDELEAKVEDIGSKVGVILEKITDFSTDFTAALKVMQDKIDALPTGEATDLAPAMAGLDALGTKLDGIATALEALDETAEGVSGSQTPPVA